MDFEACVSRVLQNNFLTCPAWRNEGDQDSSCVERNLPQAADAYRECAAQNGVGLGYNRESAARADLHIRLASRFQERPPHGMLPQALQTQWNRFCDLLSVSESHEAWIRRGLGAGLFGMVVSTGILMESLSIRTIAIAPLPASNLLFGAVTALLGSSILFAFSLNRQMDVMAERTRNHAPSLNQDEIHMATTYGILLIEAVALYLGGRYLFKIKSDFLNHEALPIAPFVLIAGITGAIVPASLMSEPIYSHFFERRS